MDPLWLVKSLKIGSWGRSWRVLSGLGGLLVCHGSLLECCWGVLEASRRLLLGMSDIRVSYGRVSGRPEARKLRNARGPAMHLYSIDISRDFIFLDDSFAEFDGLDQKCWFI